MAYVLGLDISTTGAKALLVDDTGAVVHSHSTPHPISQPQPLWSEQDPADWWMAMRTSIQQVLMRVADTNAIVSAIGLTGQMHGLVCLDALGRVLRPAILWNDQRTQKQCDSIIATIGESQLIKLTGNRALTGFTAPKLLWIREHEPEVYAQIAHILLPKDYIRYKLTGQFHTDLAGASGTLLLDVKHRIWSQTVVDALDIPDDWLPKVHEGTAVTGGVTALAASEVGLSVGTPVVGGGGDQAAQAVGVGAVQPGIVALTLGTSGVVFAPLAAYAFEPTGRLHAFCHALPGQYHFMGVMLSAAGSLQWYRDTLFPDTSIETLVDEASTVPAGAEGLFFLPYLTGERTPHADPLARGAFIGLTTRHKRAHMTRSVLEGVGYGLRDSFELIRDCVPDMPLQQMRVSGGGARSELWLQILASTLNEPLHPVSALEGAAYGAALLAGMQVGFWEDVNEMIQTEAYIPPIDDRTVYDRGHEIYQSLYPALCDGFGAMASI